MARYYGVYRADPTRDVLITRRVNKRAAAAVAARLQAAHPDRPYFACRDGRHQAAERFRAAQAQRQRRGP